MKIEDFPIFLDNMDSLKEMSKDTSQTPVQYMTELMAQAINFDYVKRVYTNGLGLSEDVAKSFDTLALIPDGTIFIEFKNGRVKAGDIKNKIRDSLLIYGGITGQTISETRHTTEFILVYNPEKNIDKRKNDFSKKFIINNVIEKAQKEIIKFDLERYQTLYFRAVHTYTVKELEDYLSHKGISIELETAQE